MHFFGVSYSWLIGAKDFSLLVFMLIALMMIRLNRKDYFPLLIPSAALIILLGFFLISPAAIPTVLASVRQLGLFFLFYLFGVLLMAGRTGATFYYAKLCVVRVGVICALIGFVERFTHLWSFFVAEYFLYKNIGVLSNGFPFVMIEPVGFFREFDDVYGFLRMSSVFLDPINLGHACVLWFFLADRIGYGFKKYLFLIALILTFSKGAYMHFVFVYVLFKVPLNLYLKLLISLGAGGLGLVLMQNHAGFEKHLSGMLGGFESLSVFGGGLGTAGNVAEMFGMGAAGVSDSYFGAVIAQLGLVGALVWVVCFLLCLYLAQLNGERLVAAIVGIQFVIGFLSENAFNFLSIMCVSILCGMYAVAAQKALKPTSADLLLNRA